MPTVTTPRQHKRKFQPSVTSYFAHTARDDSTDRSSIASPTPFLPFAIQSSLLNVGMRVRQSIPQGYQTTPKPGLPTFLRPRSAPPTACAQPCYRFAELTPYCGIMKVGGHSSQPAPTEEDLPPLQFDHDNDDDFPSSQDSTTSTISMDSIPTHPSHLPHPISYNTNKRRRDALDPETDFPDSDRGDTDFQFGFQPVSPRAYPVSHTRMPNLDSIRPMCTPKTRRKKWDDYARTRRRGEDPMGETGDFDEAGFFDPMAGLRRRWRWGGSRAD